MTEYTQLQVGVKAILLKPDNTFLVVKRSAEKYPEVGATWDIPGGRIEISDPLVENLKREVFEETKITFDSKPELIHAQDIFVPAKNRRVVRLTYLVSLDANDVNVQIDEENTESQWVSLSHAFDLKDLDTYLKDALKVYENRF